MRYVGNTAFTTVQHPSGHGWVALFTCPGPSGGCGANGVALADTQTGPFNGWCSRGHEIHFPYATPISEGQ